MASGTASAKLTKFSLPSLLLFISTDCVLAAVFIEFVLSFQQDIKISAEHKNMPTPINFIFFIFIKSTSLLTDSFTRFNLTNHIIVFVMYQENNIFVVSKE